MEAVHPLKWFPNENAWEVRVVWRIQYQINVGRNKLRKSPLFSDLHSYLVEMTQAGVISRLEAVSMIPPLFLDVHPDHLVLDLCAAPGSKTQQILEMLKSGVIVANDANPQRALMLVNQTSHAPTTKLVVTSYLAQQFPVPKTAGKTVQFDRILCDVPCSGDGTLVGIPAGARHSENCRIFGPRGRCRTRSRCIPSNWPFWRAR